MIPHDEVGLPPATVRETVWGFLFYGGLAWAFFWTFAMPGIS